MIDPVNFLTGYHAGVGLKRVTLTVYTGKYSAEVDGAHLKLGVADEFWVVDSNQRQLGDCDPP